MPFLLKYVLNKDFSNYLNGTNKWTMLHERENSKHDDLCACASFKMNRSSSAFVIDESKKCQFILLNH